MIIPYNNIHPSLAPDVFIAESAAVIGDVQIGAGSNVWYGCVIRGDVHSIRIGKNTNVQDLSIIHVTGGKYFTEIGDNCTLGHRVTIHGSVLRDGSFVGMGATILDGCEMGEYSMLAAGSLLPPGKKIPPGMLAMGSPAKIIREVRPEEKEMFMRTAIKYTALAAEYKMEMKKNDSF